MEKNWFILNKDHHKGPFSSIEMEDFFNKGRINNKTMVWMKNLNDWDNFENISFFSDFLYGEIPPLPLSSNGVDILPPIPEEYYAKKKEKVRPVVNKKFQRTAQSKNQAKEIVVPSIPAENFFSPPNELIEKIKSSLILPLKMTLAGFIILFIGVMTYLFTGNKVKERTFTHVKKDEFKRLKSHTKSEFKGNLKMDFAFSKKGQILWGSSNIKGPATMFLTLKSIDGRILSDGKIYATSTAELKGSAVKFDKFNFIEGEHLPVGEYSIEVVRVEKGMKQKLDNYIKDRTPASRKLKYKGKIYTFKSSKDNFEVQLKKFKRYIRLQKNIPLQDRLEKYRTLGSLVQRLGSLYKTHLKKSGKMKSFENQYGMSVGPILQGIIIDNHHKVKKLKHNNPRSAKKYLKLLDYGKRIGELASDMMTKTISSKKLSRSKKSHLKVSFMKRVDNLKSLGELRISKISKEIDRL